MSFLPTWRFTLRFKIRVAKQVMWRISSAWKKLMTKLNDLLSITLWKAMGFPRRILSTIMNFVNTFSFSILINGFNSYQYSPKKGIRQGGPLSPYLFILCTEVLYGLISNIYIKGSSMELILVRQHYSFPFILC